MPNGKSPGYEHFWDDLKVYFIKYTFETIWQSNIDDHLLTSQRQTIIKVIAKKDRKKCFVKNWRLIPLLNVDTKILSKPLAEKLRHALSKLLSSNQTAYVKNQYMSESRRLISYVNEMCDLYWIILVILLEQI